MLSPVVCVCVASASQRAAIIMYHNSNTIYEYDKFSQASRTLLPYRCCCSCCYLATVGGIRKSATATPSSRAHLHLVLMLHGNEVAALFNFHRKANLSRDDFMIIPARLPQTAASSRINRCPNRATNMIVGELGGCRGSGSGADVLGLQRCCSPA